MEITLENDLLRVTVTTWGGQLKSVVRKCDGVEHMWSADPDYWDYHAPILFPHCGPVKDGSFTAKGQRYKAAFHGFSQPMEHRVLARGRDFVRLEITDTPETYARWPYHFRLETTYTLTGDTVRHSVTIENRDETEMPFGFGFHPGFAVPFDDRHTADDYEIRFSRLESPLCIAMGRRGTQANTLYGLGRNIRSLPLDRTLFKGPSHCMVNLASTQVSLWEKDTGRRVTCDIAGFPYTLLWTEGRSEKPRFLCIEPWHSIPSPEEGSDDWADKPAAEILAPGGVWHTELTVHFAR